MVKYCPDCGCPLTETNWGRKFCPVCGEIKDKEESTETNYSNYIG